eukprot:sb/3472385/
MYLLSHEQKETVDHEEEREKERERREREGGERDRNCMFVCWALQWVSRTTKKNYRGYHDGEIDNWIIRCALSQKTEGTRVISVLKLVGVGYMALATWEWFRDFSLVPFCRFTVSFMGGRRRTFKLCLQPFSRYSALKVLKMSKETVKILNGTNEKSLNHSQVAIAM